MNRPGIRAASWVVGLLAALAALRLAGGGELAAPPLGSLDALDRWVTGRGAVAASIALVRFAAELAVWYLLGLSLLHAVAGLLRVRGIAALADALALPGTTRVVRAGLGFGLLASTAMTAESSVPPAAAQRVGVAVMSPIEVDEPAPTGSAAMTPLVEQDPAPVAPPSPTTYRVESGDSFWVIAADTLAGAWGRRPTDLEIDPYWRSLVDANRDRLVGDDPDLILPGQVFELPPVPPPPT